MEKENLQYGIFCVTEFGAAGDGKTLNTEAIQNAVDACHASGGGTVLFPKGVYLTGTIFMKSYVTLRFQQNAVLKGSREQEDYPTEYEKVHRQRYDLEPHMNTALIYGEDCREIGFEGPGTIHGNGQEWEGFYRPMMLRFLRCRDIRMTDLKLRNPGSWNTAFLECRKIFIRGLDIRSVNNGNGDGLDFDSCQDVVVSDCILDCSDDCICLQNSVPESVCGNITVNNCILTSKWAAFRFGLLSRGNFEDITVGNCVIHDVDCSGFKIQMSEGGTMKNILVHHITMRNVPRPVMITLNEYGFLVDGGEIPKGQGKIRGLKFDHLLIDTEEKKGPMENGGIILQGIPGMPVRDVVFSHIDYTVYGMDAKAPVPLSEVPDMRRQRPEYFVWDRKLPCCAVFIDQAEEIEFDHVRIRCLHPSEKPAVAVRNAKDIRMDRIRVSGSGDGKWMVTERVQGLEMINSSPETEYQEHGLSEQ